MAAILAVPPEYGYVVATTAGTFFLGFWHGARVSSFRKAAGIKYPQSYAENSDMASASAEKKHEMYLFNCAQRAHGNYNENHPSVAIAMLISGLQYPMITTALGAVWSISRVVYAVGYTKRDRTDGKGRLAGAGFWFAQLGLFGLSAWTGLKMVL